MASSEILTIAVAALKATGSVGVISVIGAALAWRGVLDRAGVKVLGMLTFKLLMPSMVFASIAGGMSLPFLRDFWGLCVFGAVMCATGFLVGRIAVVFSGAPASFRHWFCLACAFPNIFAIPLVYIEAICRKESDDPSAAESCIFEGNTRLFTFIMLFPLILYGFGGSYAMSCMLALKSSSQNDAGGAQLDDATEAKQADAASADGKLDVEQPTLPKLLGKETQEAVTAQEVPKPVAPAAISPRKEANDVGGWRWQLNVIVFHNPPVLATIAGVVVAMLPPVQMLLFGKSAPLQFVTNAFAVVGKATPCISNIVMAASLGLQLKKCTRWADVLGGGSTGISRRTLLTLVFTKMVIMPAVTFCSLWFLQDSLPEDRWYRLLLFMECATPTANNIVILASVLGDQDAAQLLALTTISQFAIFLPMSTLITAVGLGVTDHLV